MERAKVEAAIADIKDVCAKHGVVLIGLADSIYGEIGIFDAKDETSWWLEMRSVLFNFEDHT